MHAGAVISFKLSDWPVDRYGQVLAVRWDEIAVKLLGCADIIYLQDWIFTYKGNRLEILTDVILQGDSILPLKTIVHRSIRQRTAPSLFKRWKAWCRNGQYRYYKTWTQWFGWDAFWQLRYKVQGLLCIDGYLVPVNCSWREKPFYLEQYNILAGKYPDIWEFIGNHKKN